MVTDLKKTIPQDIQYDATELRIEWKDGHLSRYNLLDLRKKCPCATCRGGHGGKVGDATGHIQAASIISWSKVGRYAINIVWNDYHNTGIYSFDNLRAYGDGLKDAFDH
ncbi:DUF971 domain-containing protein [Leptospira sp. GIMC2001]|uniref:DUF971 domain-containing protein n=1 Tax=Leptospira sp. GIMC2001 TaxID=1513297 RepID=UPI00234BDE8E|nr:DUF971 domain-containing protein [Leptospira sp. GIMC2001]WCL48276.1 DUF971 domain-containing protein [Leptospira sp. GIMC2001]